MKIIKVEQKTQEWHNIRRGKITGTVLKKLLGTKTTSESCFYEVLAERLSVPSDFDESDLERGERLEDEAIEEFEKLTGKIVHKIGFCESDSNEYICNSPDGLIKKGKKYPEAVEVKCLASKNHLKAVLENKVPSDYYPQAVQYFIVNKDLKTLYFVLYDPRVLIKPLHIIVVNRKDILEDIEEYEKAEIEFLEKVENKINELVTI